MIFLAIFLPPAALFACKKYFTGTFVLLMWLVSFPLLIVAGIGVLPMVLSMAIAVYYAKERAVSKQFDKIAGAITQASERIAPQPGVVAPMQQPQQAVTPLPVYSERSAAFADDLLSDKPPQAAARPSPEPAPVEASEPIPDPVAEPTSSVAPIPAPSVSRIDELTPHVVARAAEPEEVRSEPAPAAEQRAAERTAEPACAAAPRPAERPAEPARVADVSTRQFTNDEIFRFAALGIAGLFGIGLLVVGGILGWKYLDKPHQEASKVVTPPPPQQTDMQKYVSPVAPPEPRKVATTSANQQYGSTISVSGSGTVTLTPGVLYKWSSPSNVFIQVQSGSARLVGVKRGTKCGDVINGWYSLNDGDVTVESCSNGNETQVSFSGAVPRAEVAPLGEPKVVATPRAVPPQQSSYGTLEFPAADGEKVLTMILGWKYHVSFEDLENQYVSLIHMAGRYTIRKDNGVLEVYCTGNLHGGLEKSDGGITIEPCTKEAQVKILAREGDDANE